MYNIIKTFRFALILIFILSVVFLFFKHLFIPILIFILIMRLLKVFKFRKIHNKKEAPSNSNSSSDNKIIDAEYEELD